MDELKKYIQQNTGKLNADEPGPEVWNRVRREVTVIKTVSTVSSFTKWAMAACVLALAGAGVWYLLSGSKPDVQKTTANIPVEKKATPATVAPEKTVPASEEKQPQTITASNSHKPTPNKSINKQPSLNSMELGELYELENSFSQVINLQRATISTIPMYAETPEYFKDFKLQLKQIEKDEKGIKSDITRNGMNGELLDQLINLYQQKLSVLKQLQLEMNKTNNRYKQNRAPIDSTKSYFLNL